MKRKIILVADDDSKDAETVRKLFKEAKVLNPVQIVCDDAQAIAYLEGSGKYADRSLSPYPALLLLDLVMHQDGHSLLLASTIPTLLTYDSAFAYEVAVIIADGIRRRYGQGEEIFYYLALYNENYLMPPMPEGVEDGVLKGLYKFKRGSENKKHKAHLFGSGPIISEALRAREILAERYEVSADVWSATNYKLLRNDALRCRRWNMLHPTEPQRKAHVQTLLENENGVFVAVSDNMKIVPDQIAPWVPGGLMTLGTDGFGRSDTRANLRRFFEVDAELIVIATLYALAQKGELEGHTVAKAIKALKIDPEKVYPATV